ncbi:MAG: cytochrome c [Bryobacterales bacterium]|nr:cytochrome c [Bryobacterales bacterium]
MNRLAIPSLIVLLSLVVSVPKITKAQAKGSSDQSLVARGKYIVEDVAMCERCHTPRDEHGNPEMNRWLKGGPVQNVLTYPTPTFAGVEPRIAGSPPGTDATFITLMTTGIARTGKPPDPPMPQFHMTRQDAEAVLAYLKSLR